MENWNEFYETEFAKVGGVENWIKPRLKHRKPFLDKIENYLPVGGSVLEAGCGTGVTSCILAQKGYRVTAIDTDDKMLGISNKIADCYGSQDNLTIKKQSVFNMDYPQNAFDVCFNRGVLEHFSDEEMIEALNKMHTAGKVGICSVPTEYFLINDRLKGHGDERFLKTSEWKNLIEKSDGKLIETFSHHRRSALQRLFDVKHYLSPKPYNVYVFEKAKQLNR